MNSNISNSSQNLNLQSADMDILEFDLSGIGNKSKILNATNGGI